MITSSRSTKGPSGGNKSGGEKTKSDKKSSSKKSSDKKGRQSIDLKVGKFDGGMLKLSAKDLAKMKKK
jgi:hypothetical protein